MFNDLPILSLLISFLPEGEMTAALRTLMGVYTEYWGLILGVILILLIFFLPEGVMGFFLKKFKPRAEEATEKGIG